MVFHFMSNILGATMPVVFLGADQVMYRILFVSVASLFAMILVGVPQFKMRQRKAEAI